MSLYDRCYIYEYTHRGECSVCEKDIILWSAVCMSREDGCMYAIGYCNFSLKNKDTGYHFPLVFFHIELQHKSLYQLCVTVSIV
jgi:hypothetical protein